MPLVSVWSETSKVRKELKSVVLTWCPTFTWCIKIFRDSYLRKTFSAPDPWGAVFGLLILIHRLCVVAMESSDFKCFMRGKVAKWCIWGVCGIFVRGEGVAMYDKLNHEKQQLEEDRDHLEQLVEQEKRKREDVERRAQKEISQLQAELQKLRRTQQVCMLLLDGTIRCSWSYPLLLQKIYYKLSVLVHKKKVYLHKGVL